MTSTVQIRRKGVITIPVELRRRYKIDEGDVYTLVELGDGSLLLAPQVSKVAHHGDRVAEILEEENVTLDEMLQALDEERERYYQEQYDQG